MAGQLARMVETGRSRHRQALEESPKELVRERTIKVGLERSVHLL